jgi:hypothetical protein
MRVICQAFAAILALVAMPAIAHASPGPLAPRNECADTQGLAELDHNLRRAARDRDAEALLTLVDDDITLDFGGGSGKPELLRRLTAPDYRLWDELDAALALGCGVSREGGIVAYAAWPWYFARDIIPFDPFEAFIVTGQGVRLRANPDPSGAVIGVVSWDYVRIADYPEQDVTYARVETRNGTKGYIAAAYLRSLVDYRLVANQRDGKWQVTAFIAGD